MSLGGAHSDHNVIRLGLDELSKAAGRSVPARLGAQGTPEGTREGELEHGVVGDETGENNKVEMLSNFVKYDTDS
jgi:hypothetical protein